MITCIWCHEPGTYTEPLFEACLENDKDLGWLHEAAYPYNCWSQYVMSEDAT